MSRFSCRVSSIELKDSIFETIDKKKIIRLNFTQMPSRITDEYLLKNINCIQNINHEFIIDDPLNKADKLTMTVSSVVKKTNLMNILGLNSYSNHAKDYPIDKYIDHTRDNNRVHCEYYETNHSFIGYCTIELKEIIKGINNSLHVELLNKDGSQVVGYANLDIYSWNSNSVYVPQNLTDCTANEPVMFVDPGCPVVNN